MARRALTAAGVGGIMPPEGGAADGASRSRKELPMRAIRSIPMVLGLLLALSSGVGQAAPAPIVGGQTPTPAGQVRTFVGDIGGLQNIDAKFVAIVAPNGNAVAYLSSNGH